MSIVSGRKLATRWTNDNANSPDMNAWHSMTICSDSRTVGTNRLSEECRVRLRASVVWDLLARDRRRQSIRVRRFISSVTRCPSDYLGHTVYGTACHHEYRAPRPMGTNKMRGVSTCRCAGSSATRLLDSGEC